MLIPVLALAMMQGVCPMTIGVGKEGTLFTDRFQGWYKTSQKSLDGDLHGGCYNDANPHSVTSVKLFIAPGAPKQRLDLVFSILQEDGWPRDKVQVQSWDEYPRRPR
jgi:hypothetical protein